MTAPWSAKEWKRLAVLVTPLPTGARPAPLNSLRQARQLSIKGGGIWTALQCSRKAFKGSMSLMNTHLTLRQLLPMPSKSSDTIHPGVSKVKNATKKTGDRETTHVTMQRRQFVLCALSAHKLLDLDLDLFDLDLFFVVVVRALTSSESAISLRSRGTTPLSLAPTWSSPDSEGAARGSAETPAHPTCLSATCPVVGV